MPILRSAKSITCLVLLCAACSRMHRSNAPAPAAAATRPQVVSGPSDANIAAILLAANNTDISYARLAPARAQSAAIKEFAQRMLTDHTAVLGLINDLMSRIDLTPVDNSTSLDFRDESAAKRDILRELEGRAFDTTYIANEVSYHTRLLASIDNSLLPSARNPQLRQLVANIRQAVAAHLAHAQEVRASVLSR